MHKICQTDSECCVINKIKKKLIIIGTCFKWRKILTFIKTSAIAYIYYIYAPIKEVGMNKTSNLSGTRRSPFACTCI